jgi:peptidoglycan hydrolase-like protein with peptidoglycan-binding domain
MAPPFSGTLIHPGDSSNECWTWQQRMLARGWHILETGTHDTQSELVCRAFQYEKGLQLDGIIGPETWAAAWDTPITPGPGGPHPISLAVFAVGNRQSNDSVEVVATVTNTSQSPLLTSAMVTTALRVMNNQATSVPEVTLQQQAVPELGPGFGVDLRFHVQCPPLTDGNYDAHVSVYDASNSYAHTDTTFQ